MQKILRMWYLIDHYNATRMMMCPRRMIMGPRKWRSAFVAEKWCAKGKIRRVAWEAPAGRALRPEVGPSTALRRPPASPPHGGPAQNRTGYTVWFAVRCHVAWCGVIWCNALAQAAQPLPPPNITHTSTRRLTPPPLDQTIKLQLIACHP